MSFNKKPAHSQRAHAVLSASSSERWTICTGSVQLALKCPKPPSSEYADEGTAAHELGEKCLKTGKNARDFLGQTFNKKWKVTEEMAEAVQVYVDYIRAQMSPHKTLLLEQKFSLEWLHPGMFGTNDGCLKEDFGTLEIVDYKHGKGVAVDVEENRQLLYYALGAMFDGKEIDTSFDKIKITIVQPRANHSDGPVRSWETNAEFMVSFAKFLKAKALETENTKPTFKSGDHCRWCPAKQMCPELHKSFKEVAKIEFSDIDDTPKEFMPTLENVSEVLSKKTAVLKLIEACEQFALERLMSGESVKGLKLVRGRGSRTWAKPEEEIESVLLDNFTPDQIFETGLKSVSKMEKAIGKNALEGLVEEKLGGLQVALENDKRKAVIPAAQDFQQIPKED